MDDPQFVPCPEVTSRPVVVASARSCRGYCSKVIPITWRNRRTGVATLKIREMASRYLFMVAYMCREKYFSRVDYRRREQAG